MRFLGYSQFLLERLEIGSFPGNLLLVAQENSVEKRYTLLNQDTITGDIVIRSSPSGWTVEQVAAEKGQGPFLYEVAMMSVYPEYLSPSYTGDTSDSALQVWKKFYQRTDVERKGESLRMKPTPDYGRLRKESLSPDERMSLNRAANQFYSSKAKKINEAKVLPATFSEHIDLGGVRMPIRIEFDRDKRMHAYYEDLLLCTSYCPNKASRKAYMEVMLKGLERYMRTLPGLIIEIRDFLSKVDIESVINLKRTDSNQYLEEAGDEYRLFLHITDHRDSYRIAYSDKERGLLRKAFMTSEWEFPKYPEFSSSSVSTRRMFISVRRFMKTPEYRKKVASSKLGI